MVSFIEPVILSAYITTSPFRFRAARPAVCVSALPDLQEPLLVGIEDGHQRHLRQVKPFTQQVDTHQHIKLP